MLEDPYLTNAEYRLVTYLATKPEGWTIHARQLAAALGRSSHEIDTALAGLRRLGYVTNTQERGGHGRFGTWASVLRRELVVAPDAKPQVSTADPESTPPVATCGNTASPQVGTGEPDHRSAVIHPPIERTDLRARTDSPSENGQGQVPASPLRGDAGPYTPTDIRAAVAARFIDLDDDDLDTITAVLCDRQAANRIAHLDRYVGALSEITINYWLATYEPEETTP